MKVDASGRLTDFPSREEWNAFLSEIEGVVGEIKETLKVARIPEDRDKEFLRSIVAANRDRIRTEFAELQEAVLRINLHI